MNTLEQLKKHLSGHVRLRLSISARDLGGKTVRQLLFSACRELFCVDLLLIYIRNVMS